MNAPEISDPSSPASPGSAEGYIRIQNNLWEALTTYQLSPKEWRVMGLIIRLSVGCNKEVALIKPMNRFRLAGIHQPDIRKTITGLMEKEVIHADIEDGLYRVNLCYEEWQLKRTNYNREDYGRLVGYNLRTKYSESLSENIVNHYTQYSESLCQTASESSNDKNLHAPKDKHERQEIKTTHSGGVFGLSPMKVRKLMGRYGEDAVMKRVKIIHSMDGRIRSKAAYLIKSLQDGWMPMLSERELETKTKLAEAEAELAAVEADDDMSHFPDPASFGIRRSPEEVKADLIQRLETKVTALKRRLRSAHDYMDK